MPAAAAPCIGATVRWEGAHQLFCRPCRSPKSVSLVHVEKQKSGWVIPTVLSHSLHPLIVQVAAEAAAAAGMDEPLVFEQSFEGDSLAAVDNFLW